MIINFSTNKQFITKIELDGEVLETVDEQKRNQTEVLKFVLLFRFESFIKTISISFNYKIDLEDKPFQI